MVSFTGACEQSMLFIDDTVPTLSGAGGLRHGAEEGLRRASRRGRKSHTLTDPKYSHLRVRLSSSFPPAIHSAVISRSLLTYHK